MKKYIIDALSKNITISDEPSNVHINLDKAAEELEKVFELSKNKEILEELQEIKQMLR